MIVGRQSWLLMVFSIVAFSLLMVTWPSDRQEPEFQGKKLEAWLDEYCRGTEARKDEAAIAVRRIGSDAIPHLVKLLRERDSNISGWLKTLLRKIGIHRRMAWEANWHGLAGFIILGEDAKAAVPALIVTFEESLSPSSRAYTASALGWIGPAASGSVPSLLKAVARTNDFDRTPTILALGSIHAKASEVVPVLVQCLNDSNRAHRVSAMKALAEFGPEARQAVPALVKLLEDRDGRSARMALEKIAPP